jgi:site-specific recombinase XerD
VGLDYGDINIKEGAFVVTRKGGKRTILYMGEQLKDKFTVFFENDFKPAPPPNEADGNITKEKLQANESNDNITNNILTMQKKNPPPPNGTNDNLTGDNETNAAKTTQSDETKTVLPNEVAPDNKNSSGLNSGLKIASPKWTKETPVFQKNGRRLNVRTVVNIIHKYAEVAAPLKKISPHKLRSTFGTNLYRATGDIYAVATVLGHTNVDITRKHYAAITDDIIKKNADAVKI